MQIYYNTFPDRTPSAVALGNFDGVHVAHTQLINLLTSLGLKSVVYTFEKHPRNQALAINTNEEKAELFETLGVDEVIFADFNEVKDFSPEQFVDKILVEKLAASVVVCGYNYHFGKDAVGDVETLRGLLSQRGIELKVIDEVLLLGIPVSSSLIRDLLSNGELEKANSLLGRPYFINSMVVHGKAFGRQLGFPTINESFSSNRMVLPYGVYFGRCVIDRYYSHPAVVNVGIRPTVNSTDLVPCVEAHLIDFKGNLYDKLVKIQLFKKHREEQRFSDLEALKAQIASDVEECRSYFEERY